MTTETNETNRNGSITAGLTTGIIGTALGALNTIGGGAALLSGNARQSSDVNGIPQWVSKDEYNAGMTIASKDSEIALLKSERDAEKKMIEVYAKLEERINNVKDIVATNRDRADDKLAAAYEKLDGKINFNKNLQDGINAQQLAYNGTNSSTISFMQSQIAQLQSITKTVVPNSSCCPGWGTVTITPSTLSA